MMTSKSNSQNGVLATTPRKIIVGILVLALLYLAYVLFIKDGVVKVSGSAISRLIDMDVRFESYEFLNGGSLEITGLVITSPYPREKYRDENEYQRDWISAEIGSIRLENFDYERLIEYREWFASKITIDSARITIYKDKTLPEPPFEYKGLPATLLQKIEGSVKVDTIDINHMLIQYDERNKHSDAYGVITFNDLTAECYNLTNDSAALTRNPTFRIVANTRAFDRAEIEADIRFDMTHPNDAFTMKATVGPVAATTLNSMVAEVLPAVITDGEIHGMNLDMAADDDRSSGTLEFEYSDLKFKVDNGDEGSLGSVLATAAGRVIVRKNNLPGGNYRVGEIGFDRRKDRFIFNYWWNSLKSGLVDVMMSDAGRVIKLDEKAMEVQ